MRILAVGDRPEPGQTLWPNSKSPSESSTSTPTACPWWFSRPTAGPARSVWVSARPSDATLIGRGPPRIAVTLADSVTTSSMRLIVWLIGRIATVLDPARRDPLHDMIDCMHAAWTRYRKIGFARRT